MRKYSEAESPTVLRPNHVPGPGTLSSRTGWDFPHGLTIWRTLLVIGGGLLILVNIGRGYQVAEFLTPPLTGIGESRWWHFSTNPGMREVFIQLASEARDSWELPARTSELDAAWLLSVVRWGCPRSRVELQGTTLESSNRLIIEPSCLVESPEFLTTVGKASGHGAIRSFFVVFTALLGFWLVGSRVPGAAGYGMPERVLVGWAVSAGLTGIAVALRVPTRSVLPVLVLGAMILLALEARGRSRLGLGQRPHLASTRGAQAQAWRPCRGIHLVTVTSTFAAIAVSAAKIWTTPVWSWDHYAMWGYKARQLAQGRADFLSAVGFDGANPNYPLGWPRALTSAGWGAAPSALDVRVLWLALMALLILLFHRLASQVDPSVGLLATAALATSPLFWDTEAVGLAELPMVLFMLGGLVSAANAARSGNWGFLASAICWIMVSGIKNDGNAVCLLVLPAAIVLAGGWRVRRAQWLAATTVVGVLVVRAITSAQTSGGVSFFAGDALGRMRSRLGHPLPLLRLMVEQMNDFSWLALWWILPPLVLIGVIVRATASKPSTGAVEGLLSPLQSLRFPELSRVNAVLCAALLAAAGLGLLSIFASVYAGTHFPPDLHILTSWHRVVVTPLLLLLLAAALLAPRSDPPDRLEAGSVERI